MIIRPPESVAYKDEFGQEELTIKHGLTAHKLTACPDYSRQNGIVALHTKPKLTHDNRIFFFKVLKEEPVGMGLGWPDLATLFHACSLNESLLVGDRQLAMPAGQSMNNICWGMRSRRSACRQPGDFMKKCLGRGQEGDSIQEGSYPIGHEFRSQDKDWRGTPEAEAI